MLYRNDDPRAILAMEEARTGNYGEDGYYEEDDDDDELRQICPVCGEVNPYYFVIRDYNDKCIGCSECLREEYYLHEENL